MQAIRLLQYFFDQLHFLKLSKYLPATMLDMHTILYKWRSRLHGLPRDAGWRMGMLKQARGSRILTYHGVCNEDPFRYNTLFTKLKTFEAQLQLYRKYCQVISLEDLYTGNFHPSR